MGALKHLRSKSEVGLSTIYVDIKDTLPPSAMPRIWTNLRERVRDAQRLLPRGTEPSLVIDHYGRSYGILMALSGDGFTMSELRRHANDIRRRLKKCEDAAGVIVFGVRDEVIVMEIPRERLASLQIDAAEIYQTLTSQNYLTDFGYLNAGDARIRIDPSGDLKSVEEIENIVLGGEDGKYLRLGDVFDVRREYVDPPEILFRMNGKPALAIGVSTIKDGNTVTLGKSVKKTLRDIASRLPAGLDVTMVNFQADRVTQSINTFVTALIQAVVIVLIVLLVALGFRSAMVITNGLIFNICATFIVMNALGIDLQCVSLCSLVIVLGMLVDDSVVVTENTLVLINQKGLPKERVGIQAAGETGWPQLLATFIAIASFLPMALADSSTGEYCQSLTYVVAIALGASWVQAMVVVPVMSVKLLKPKRKLGDEKPYSSRFYRVYLALLRPAIRHRWLTTGLVFLVFCLACYGLSHVKHIFMRMSDRPQFTVDYWLPEGARIKTTSADLAAIEKELLSWSEIESVATTVGGGPPRFMLGFTPEEANVAYGNMIVNTKADADVRKLMDRTETFMHERFPEAAARAAGFMSGGAPNFEIEARISGDDPVKLRRLAEKIETIMMAAPGAEDVELDWRGQVPVWRPEYSQVAGGFRSVDRESVVGTMRWLTKGYDWDEFRGDDYLRSIVSRVPRQEDHDLRDVSAIPITPWKCQRGVPLGAVVTKGEIVMENPIIRHCDRVRTITVRANPAIGVNCGALRRRLAAKINGVTLPPGYELAWGGMYEQAKESNDQIPLTLILMLIAVVLLFNGVRGPLIVILSLPLSIVGVVIALLLTGEPMGFMAMFGISAFSRWLA